LGRLPAGFVRKQVNNFISGRYIIEYVELMKGVEFNETHGIARPIHVDKNGRLLQFALRPGQKIKEHSSPSSPVYLLVLEGKGIFRGADNVEIKAGPGSILIFDVDEKHSIQALEEDLIFVAILHGSPRDN
jgi:quercetin dioxygenase-like cupin family protein